MGDVVKAGRDDTIWSVAHGVEQVSGDRVLNSIFGLKVTPSIGGLRAVFCTF
jgi:hypothetical protein